MGYVKVLTLDEAKKIVNISFLLYTDKKGRVNSTVAGSRALKPVNIILFQDKNDLWKFVECSNPLVFRVLYPKPRTHILIVYQWNSRKPVLPESEKTIAWEKLLRVMK